MKQYSDEQLVQKYLPNKDEELLENLVERYLPLIYSYVRNYTGSQENASDITQETFVKVWKNIKSFDESKSFRTWIFTIAKHTAIDWLKKKNALPFSLLEQENNFSESLIDPAPSIFEKLLLQDTSRQMKLALAQLPGNYSKVIKLHLNQDLSFREISESLKQPLNTVKSQYRRGLALLKNLVEK